MPRKPTLLLVFIHGFKGDDDTFVEFPEYLQASVQSARPELRIAVAKYPRYETRGELPACVARFREWLENTVIDLEVAAGTPHATVDPSVHVILIGHSMGGIVAADTVLSIINDKPIASGQEVGQYGPDDIPLMFPHIVGVLAFDTPYLGLAPSMFAHGAEGNWNKATSVLGTVSKVTSGLGLFGAGGAAAASQALIRADADSEAARERERKEKEQANSGGFLGGWGKVAALTAATTALAGGAAAAYIHREHITNGFTWVSSHLEFVGALMKGEELNNRVQRVSTMPNIGFANLFTSMGRNFGTNSFYEGKERTFCNIPAQHTPLRKKWYRCINESVKDEVGAHVSMFGPKTNPNFYDLGDRAKQLITVWVPEGAFPIIEDDDEREYIRKKKSKSHKSSSSSKRDKEKERDRDRDREHSRSGSVSISGSPHISRTNSMEPEYYEKRKSKSDRHLISRTNSMEPSEYSDSSSSRRKSKSSSHHRDHSPSSSERRKSKHKSLSRANSMGVDPDLESIRPSSERRGSSRALIEEESSRRSSKGGRSGTGSPRYEEYEVRDREKRKIKRSSTMEI